VSGEIAAVTAKASPTVDDLLLIEDAADTNSKKSVAIGDLPGVGSSFVDDQFEVVDNTDGSKKVALEVSGVSTATTRVLSVPDADGTIELDGHSHVEADVTDLTHYDDADADARIAIHDAISDAHHTRYTDAEAIAAAQDDPDAVHDNASGEIAAVTAKATPVVGDLLLIEDSEASNAKKRITLGDLPHGVERVIFTSSGTFSKASYPEARLARVLVVGAGGGAGGAPATGSSEFSAGGGGGAGGWSVEDIDLSAMATTETVTVGLGGAGGTGAAGAAGSSSSFGSFLSATGGAGGAIMAAGTLASTRLEYGSDGGVGSGGDINGRGEQADDIVRLSSGLGIGGGLFGGASILSAGGVRVLSANGNAGTLGAGGGGMRSGASAAARTGGVGGAGIVIVDLYG
jgi:hypothetical protein